MTARVILHLPDIARDGFRQMKIYGIHAAIDRIVTSRGGQVLVAGRPDALFRRAPLPGDGDVHIVENGMAQGPGYLNAAVAYLDGFYHLDPKGVLADSAIADLTFQPGSVDLAAARAFQRDLRRRFVAARHSRYAQKKAPRTLPEGAIAVFLQGPKPERQGQAHMSTAAMLRTVCAVAGGRPVVVKPHPLKPDLGAEQIARARAEGAQLIQTDANVHDILAAAAVSVSLNSATGFEGLLHGTPAIFFGRTDFYQCVETVRQPDDFPQALQRALARKPGYARALYWYFGQHCLWMEDAGLDAKVLDRLAAAGFPPDRLGLSA